MIQYKAGKYVYTVEDNAVLVTKNTQAGMPESVALYKYPTDDQADEAAYNMAVKTARFNNTQFEYII